VAEIAPSGAFIEGRWQQLGKGKSDEQPDLARRRRCDRTGYIELLRLPLSSSLNQPRLKTEIVTGWSRWMVDVYFNLHRLGKLLGHETASQQYASGSASRQTGSSSIRNSPWETSNLFVAVRGEICDGYLEMSGDYRPACTGVHRHSSASVRRIGKADVSRRGDPSASSRF